MLLTSQSGINIDDICGVERQYFHHVLLQTVVDA